MKLNLLVATHLAALGLGLTGGWYFYRPGPPHVEPPSIAARQSDGSLVLERTTDRDALPAKRPVIPAGTKPVRVTTVEIAPTQPETAQGATQPKCPDVRVDLTTVEDKDGNKRVIAASPDGTVIGGIDVPLVEVPGAAAPKLWTGGGYYSPLNRGFGGFLNRDIGPFVVGASAGVYQIHAGTVARNDVDLRLQFGIRF